MNGQPTEEHALKPLERLIKSGRQRRWVNLLVVNLRIIIGFAFVPAGLKKALGQPFTDPTNVGVFHEFLHAFLATGPFYRFVGVVQLVAAVLLMTQRFAALGAAIMFPLLVAITALCWSTAGVPTIITATLMLLGVTGLLLWDLQKWRAIALGDRGAVDIRVEPTAATVDLGLWQWCGTAILAVYVAACLVAGGIYRPRGIELNNPSFYLLPTVVLIPIVTWVLDRRRSRRAGT